MENSVVTNRVMGPTFLPQSKQSAGPVRFLIFCSVSIILLACPVAGSKTQCTAGADQQGMYSIIPIHWNIKSAPASSGRGCVGPALYVFSLLGFYGTFMYLRQQAQC